MDAALGVFGELGTAAPTVDDFVIAAGVSRGTFYNHFGSVEELLAATSEWTTRELIERIDVALEGIEGPPLRFGIGLRLFFARAQSDRVWARFVARVWRLGGIELPSRDLEEGLRLGVFRAPNIGAAKDLIFGGVREALLRIADAQTASGYGDQMTELCLQALCTNSRQVAAILKHELPRLPAEREPPPPRKRTKE